jgi:hypothetical protein
MKHNYYIVHEGFAVRPGKYHTFTKEIPNFCLENLKDDLNNISEEEKEKFGILPSLLYMIIVMIAVGSGLMLLYHSTIKVDISNVKPK